MPEQCTECTKHEALSKDFYNLRDRVQCNEDYYKPIAGRAEILMKDYPETIDTLVNKVNELDKQNIIENNKLDAIHKRMDKHDNDELLKHKERREDRIVANRNFIVIMITMLGFAVSLGVWLINAHESTETRFTKIEHVLGIK